ncbi:MAG: hypothetical protein MJ187_00020 [Alphaproteobacteria bacterium]|nr:hypothetical protein [Alphaproteobacteria bacterium]
MSEKNNVLLWFCSKKINPKQYVMIMLALGGFTIWKEYTEKHNAENHPAYCTYDSFVGKCEPLTPFSIANIIAVEGVRLNSDGLHRVYDDGNKQMTIGFGNTVLQNGRSVTQHTAAINDSVAYNTAKWHIECNETYFTLFCYAVAFGKIDKLSEREIMAMTSIMYNSGSRLIEDNKDKNCQNRFELLRQDFKNYGANLPDSIVEQRFAQYPPVALEKFGLAWKNGESVQKLADLLGEYQRGGGGLRVRRWIEAGLLTGDITPQMLMHCPAGGVYDFFGTIGGTKDCLWNTDKNGVISVRRDMYKKFEDWLKNPVNKDGLDITTQTMQSVRYMPKNVAASIQTMNPEMRNRRTPHQIYWTEDSVGIDYNSRYADVMWCYHNEWYNVAEIKINDLLKEYLERYALLKNNLSLIYLKTNRYDSVIDNSRYILWAQNRLHDNYKTDKSQYGFAYNNAGCAYEKIAMSKKLIDEQIHMLETAQKKYELALENGYANAQYAINRVQNHLMKIKNENIK